MSKTSSVHFNDGKNMRVHFPFVFVLKQILRIIESQIEMNKVFSLIRILTSFRRCLQSNFLDQMIFVNKNWHNDPMIGCKSHFRFGTIN
jgi:hypothetical protein